VIGLEDKINDRAWERGIAFHAATYVNPPSVANSNGCFATPLSDNVKLIPLIANGTFAFAYAGSR
jgi:L,D-transpeptidase catalytic domain